MARFVTSILFQTISGHIENGFANRLIHTTVNLACWGNHNYGRPRQFRQNRFQHRRHENFNVNDAFDLSQREWTSENLVPYNKDFSNMINSSESLSKNEYEEFKKLHNITVKGSSVPYPVTQFSHIKFPSQIQELLKKENFTAPTPIQAQAWPIVLSGRDLIGIGQTGSGKTLGFSLPAIIHLMGQEKKTRGARCLVLAPTRELAQQIHGVMSNILRRLNLRSVILYGGASKINQMEIIKRSDPEVYIATPGRLLDLLNDGSADVSQCTYVVLDEADRMLDMGFEPQIRQVISQIRPDRQTLLWSATWPRDVHELAHSLTNDPVKVNIGSTELIANSNIIQEFVFTSKDLVEEKLIDVIRSHPDDKILIFANTKYDVDNICYTLRRSNIRAMGIHGGFSQSKRDMNLEGFRSGRSNILVATNVAARGIDVADISLVINYAMPENVEDYVHRIGRTARGSNTGRAISYFTPEDHALAKDLIKILEKANQEIPSKLYEFVRSKPSKKTTEFYGRRWH